MQSRERERKVRNAKSTCAAKSAEQESKCVQIKTKRREKRGDGERINGAERSRIHPDHERKERGGRRRERGEAERVCPV